MLNETVGEALLRPHVIYLRALEGLLDRGLIKGLAHITGGGLTENIPRILPEGTAVEIQKGSWPVLPIFEVMQQIGHIDGPEMFRAFNMGIGMVIVCSPANVSEIKAHVDSSGSAYIVGRTASTDFPTASPSGNGPFGASATGTPA